MNVDRLVAVEHNIYITMYIGKRPNDKVIDLTAVCLEDINIASLYGICGSQHW
jgi:hypothetical protein